MKMDFDAVVVGGGHNGLIAACYLARDGYEVALVEAAEQLGGLSTSGPYIPEAPEHVVHPAALDFMMIRSTSIVEELGLTSHGLSLIEADPPYGYLHPTGESVMFWRDPARTIDDIARFSRSDADSYARFVEVLDGILEIGVPWMRTDLMRPDPREIARSLRGLGRHHKNVDDIIAFSLSSAEALVHEYFTHPATIAAVLGLAAGSAPPDADGSGLAALVAGILHRVGSSRVRGGMQNFVTALARVFESAGGTVFTGTPVEEIAVSGGAVQGVRLADGRGLRSRVVLTTCDPKQTLGELLSLGDIDHRTRVRASYMPSNASGCDVMKIDLALSGQISFPSHARPDGLDLRKPLLMLGTAEETMESFAASRRGVLPTTPLVWAATPSGWDPSLAPRGQDVVYLYPAAVPREPLEGWPAVRDEMVKRTLHQAGRFIDGLDTLTFASRVETPDERARRARTTGGGSLFHIDFGLLRSGPLRPAWGLGSYRTPVEGLFLGGSGSHPGGGVTGLPGRLSSKRAARYLSKSGDRRRWIPGAQLTQKFSR
ncbi:phytoene desaturase family protein [Nocardia sp. NPDC059246]|uniref:phytoene desaturase family protein n=1 Tax=unclassified Nocardia TaxID=2637762 RepID=UPI003676F385